MRSNCLAQGEREYQRRLKLWRAAGRPKGLNPWMRLQPSKSQPDWVRHVVVGGWTEPAVEFVPLHRKDVPGWLAWTRIWFRGRHRTAAALAPHPGDYPNTEPSQHGDL